MLASRHRQRAAMGGAVIGTPFPWRTGALVAGLWLLLACEGGASTPQSSGAGDRISAPTPDNAGPAVEPVSGSSAPPWGSGQPIAADPTPGPGMAPTDPMPPSRGPAGEMPGPVPQGGVDASVPEPASDAGVPAPDDAGVLQPAQTCELPSSFRWTSGGPIIGPKSPQGLDFVSVKDPTVVFYDGRYHVFATAYDRGAAAGWKSVYISFSDFAEAGAAPHSYMGNWATGNTVAPQVFYFRPQDRWYLIYQWGARYSTNDDINDPGGWSAPRGLLQGEPNGALDFWVICDDADCHLFFSADDGKLYRSKTGIDNFPNFSGYEIVMSDPNPGRLFEASNVYKVDGAEQYLLLVEAYGPRYFRSWTATSLDGPWQPLADSQAGPFAGEANVTFEGGVWTRDISHGELIRSGYDEKMTLNACRMRFLFQGVDPAAAGGNYALLPYRLGLLTQDN